MALIILEGLDRSGKSTVAELYKEQGYKVVHQSAPSPKLTQDLYLEEQMQLVASAAHHNVVLDRSYYGELIWPLIYQRDSLLTEEGLDALRELENTVGTTRILMYDPHIEKHWQRCVDNKEPLTKVQFIQANKLYNTLVEKYGFTRKSLTDFVLLPETVPTVQGIKRDTAIPPSQCTDNEEQDRKTATHQKLEQANAINKVLAKRILKQKGPSFDKLEEVIRTFLNNELAKIFGEKSKPVSEQFTQDEVDILKFFANQLKENSK